MKLKTAKLTQNSWDGEIQRKLWHTTRLSDFTATLMYVHLCCRHGPNLTNFCDSCPSVEIYGQFGPPVQPQVNMVIHDIIPHHKSVLEKVTCGNDLCEHIDLRREESNILTFKNRILSAIPSAASAKIDLHEMSCVLTCSYKIDLLLDIQ
jgi:hypothetical protein